MRILWTTPLAPLVAGVAIVLTVGVRGAIGFFREPVREPAPAERLAVEKVLPEWRLEINRTLPARVNALMACPPDGPKPLRSLVYAGLDGSGGVVRFHPGSFATFTIAKGLGDVVDFGTCHVNKLAIHDLDKDGTPELFGSTSQVEPRGRPRLSVWSSDINSQVQRTMARPDIRSSWSHSLGFFPRAEGSDSAFITFCGFGEIVEYRMKGDTPSGDGFRHEELSWKKVGQLPASGEWLEVADVDHDARPEICVATGFALGEAAILLHDSPAPGAELTPKRRIDEGKRFGNVRFHIADMGRGRRELIAWWCTDLAGGDAEMIAYTLGPEGVRSRSVVARRPATGFWPDDGQFACGDLDADGRKELWFASGGEIWRYDPHRLSTEKVERVARLKDAIGPMTIGPALMGKGPTLYFARGKSIVTLRHATRS